MRSKKLTNEDFLVEVPHPRGGGIFGLVWKIVFSSRRRIRSK